MAEYVVRNGRHIAVETLPSVLPPERRQNRADRLLGCPLGWAKRVLQVVQSKEQFAVALWLHRRRAVCKSEWFDVPNCTLDEELGVSRDIKYRTLQHLKAVGAIVVRGSNKRALQVKILW